jgi:2-polyprenyl-3-methyl-5-hydroxy-6-metoxy-1,4-benzoquinol methylase
VEDLTDRIRAYWDRDSATYDRTASHTLELPFEAAVWRAVLRRVLPAPPARLLDVGAGTGALSLLAVELGHPVTALDLSENMLAQLQAKASARGLEVKTVHAWRASRSLGWSRSTRYSKPSKRLDGRAFERSISKRSKRPRADRRGW